MEELISSEKQTKQWRKNQTWYEGGKKTECEKYQINIISKLFKNKIMKTNLRLNYETLCLNEMKNPYLLEDGYDWSENFDGKIIIDNKIYLLNLKFICDAGGAQTRSLILSYKFIKCQIEYLKLNYESNIYFINIFDGNECFKNKNKFDYLKSKLDDKIKSFIFIGDLNEFQYYL
jgi:hypothetical protein